MSIGGEIMEEHYEKLIWDFWKKLEARLEKSEDETYFAVWNIIEEYKEHFKNNGVYEPIKLNPTDPKILAARQDEMHGTFTKVEELTVEEILEKYGNSIPAHAVNALLAKARKDKKSDRGHI